MSCVIVVVVFYHDVLARLIVSEHWRWTWRSKDSIISEEIVEVGDVLVHFWCARGWFHYIFHHGLYALLRYVIFLANFFLFLWFWVFFFIKEVEGEKRAVVQLVTFLILDVNSLGLIWLFLRKVHELLDLALTQVFL